MKPAAAAAADNKTRRVRSACVYRLHKRPNNTLRGLTYLYNMCSVGFKRFRWVVPSPVAVHTRTQKHVHIHAYTRARPLVLFRHIMLLLATSAAQYK